jgi:putative transposase
MRPPRIYIPGVSAHVFQRGHNRSPIFDEAFDHDHFLFLVRYAARRYGTDVHAFALMTNHYHLIATPRDASALPRTMQAIDGGYTRYYNRKHGRIGTLWSARYRAKLILDEAYWLTCLKYVEHNPVNAHMVSAPAEYRWSSYRVHAFGAFNDWLVPHRVYQQLGETPTERQQAYRAMCSVSDTVADLPQCLTL